jgi:uncharacterized protein with FMN-binding domain
MRRIVLTFLSTVAILAVLFSYRTSLGGGAAAQPTEQAHVVSGSSSGTTGQGPDPTPSGENTVPGGVAGTTGGTPSDGATIAPSPADTSGTAGAGSTVVDGASQMTRYGPVQVRVTITGGRITDVTAIQYPTAERRDLEINSFALPQLRVEVLAAQSAQVDVVSGATFTTEGYLSSLQSALDAAHFGG